jgi:crossover junction endodeoxyribonuclease RuvC
VVQYVGIDLSLTSTGLAIYDPQMVVPGGIADTQTVTSKPNKVPGYEGKLTRFQIISSKILLSLGSDEVNVFLEGPSYSSAGSSAHDLAGNWWLLYQLLVDEGCTVTVIPPTVVKTYATGKGNAGKDHVLAAAIKRYPEIDIPGNDIADAVILLAIGLRLAGCPLEDSMPATHLRALDKVTHPTRTGTP